MSRSRVLQGLLLYLVSQTKESPPFSLYCFSPYKAVAAPRCRTSPSLWPGGAPLSPGRSVSWGRSATRRRPRPRPPLTNRYSGAFRFTKRARPRHTMCANVSYTGFCERKAPLLSVCLCFTPLEAERCASVASSPSLWPGGAPLSPGRSVFMPLASSNPPRQCMEPAPTQRPNGRAAERQNLRLSRHPVTSLAANARFRQPTLLNQD